MRQVKIYIFSVVFLLLILPVCGSAVESLKAKKLLSNKESPVAKNQDIARQLREAFDEVRKTGETTRLTQLENFGEKLISYLEPYLNDASSNVRTEAVNSALKIGGKKAYNFAVLALKNSRPQISKHTAATLYFYHSQHKRHLRNEKTEISGDFSRYNFFSPENISASQEMGKALCEMSRSGNSNLESIFLLANFPNSETEIILKDSFKIKNYARSLRIRDEKALAAEITLAKLNNQQAIEYLAKPIDTQSIATLKFLLKNLTEIDSPKILIALSKSLENKTYIEGNLSSAQVVQKLGLPKGSHVDTIPRRLCDLALESFIQKLDLKPSFKIHSGIYAEQHLIEAQELIRKKLSGK